MSVLSRNNWVGQQRVDVAHMLAMQSFMAQDIRAMVGLFSGINKSYVFRGLDVVGRTEKTITIRTRNSQIFNPKDGNGAFYLGLENDPDIQLELPPDEQNVYVEAFFRRRTQVPVNTALWNPIPANDVNDAGEQFSAAIDFQDIIYLEFSINTSGWTDGAIPVMWASTGPNTIVDMRDERLLFGRLGTPSDPQRKYEFSESRSEPVTSGTGVANEINSPWRKRDASGSLNDKAFESLKDILDAIMTRISEITGSSIWYLHSAANAPVANLNLNNLFFDTLGHSLQPSLNSSFKWHNNILSGEGTVPVNGITGQIHNGLVRWRSNYGKVQWELGGTFVSNIPGGTRNYTSNGIRFQSDTLINGGNVYLLLEREVSKGSGNPVEWKSNSGSSALDGLRAVSGEAGDFVGIAIGDFIRKESEGYSRYYKVMKLAAGDSTVYDIANPTQDNMVADSSITAVELDSEITSFSAEPLRYFRSRYSNDDIYTDQTVNVYEYLDMDFQWLGRRVDNLFFLKDYGTMQDGEEVLTLDVTQAKGQRPEGSLTLKHEKGSVYNENGYSRLSSPSSSLINIYKRKRDNTFDASPGDNSDSLMSYYIMAPVGLMTPGQSLWVRLSDSVDGELLPGSVTNISDDLNNTDTNTNIYEIRDAEDAPNRTFDNRGIFLLARCITVNSENFLLFSDGSILGKFGIFIDQTVEISGDLRVRGDLIVEGSSIIANVTNIQSEDKLVTFNVGGALNSAFGGGIEIADDSRHVQDVETFNTESYVDFYFATPHGYTLGQRVGVRAWEGYSGITPGQITGDYRVVASATNPGEVSSLGPLHLRVYTYGTADSNGYFTGSNMPTTFVSPWSIRLSDSEGDYSGMSSWSFRVKGVLTAPTLTPVEDFGIVPTAHSENMVSSRIPFVYADGQGPFDDSTLDFSDKLRWENDSLIVDGAIRNTNIKTITDDYTILNNDHILLLDTSASVADITLTLPDATDNIGLVLIIKDIGGMLSYFNKRALLDTSGSDIIYLGESTPLPLDTDYMAFTLVAVTGGWVLY